MTATQTAEFSILQIIINSGVTIGAVGVAIYLIKKWMNARESTEEAIKADAKQTAKDLAERHDKACNEIKEHIRDNRNFYERTYNDLKKDISEVFQLQRIANGRVGKVEKGLALLKQSHEDRTGKMERVTDQA